MALLKAIGDYFEKLTDQTKQLVGPNKTLAEEIGELYRSEDGAASDMTKADGFLLET